MTQNVTMSGILSVVHAAFVPARLFVAAQGQHGAAHLLGCMTITIK